MKLSLTMLVLLVVLAIAATAQASVTTLSYNVPPNWSLITPAGIPLDPTPTSVITDVPIDGALYRWDAANQGLLVFDEWSPDAFGKILLTDGYWLKNTTGSTQTISFSGLNDNDTMDIWVGLPKRGWTLMGNPFSYSFPWGNAKVTDGNTTKSLYDASQYGSNWLQSMGYWWDEQNQGLLDFGIDDDFPTTNTLQPWHGYWLKSHQDKLALILESIP